MSAGFVWFDLPIEDRSGVRDFYASLLDWQADENGMLVGDGGPWASISDGSGVGQPAWVPYAQVDDVDEATARAKELGARVLRERTSGPAGDFTTIADPAGAPLALWQPAAAR